MGERNTRELERRLVNQLKAEARAVRPEFSETLHARVCQAVRQAEARTRHRKRLSQLARRLGTIRLLMSTEGQKEATPFLWSHATQIGIVRRWLSTAIAAALLIGFSMLWWHMGGSSNVVREPEKRPAAPVVAPESTIAENLIDEDVVHEELREGSLALPSAETASRLSLMVDSSLSEGQWAYLDHDARVAVDMLIGHFPLDMVLSE